MQPRSNEQNKPLAMSRFDFSLTPLPDLKLVQRKVIEEHHSLVGSTLMRRLQTSSPLAGEGRGDGGIQKACA